MVCSSQDSVRQTAEMGWVSEASGQSLIPLDLIL